MASLVNIKYLSEYFLFQAIKFFSSFFPRKACLSAGRALGLFFYFVDKRHRSIAQSNLKTAFGTEFSSHELKNIARSSFKHFCEVLIDILKFSRLSKEEKKELLVVEGEDNLNNALRKGKGVLIFSAHYGNWEIIPFFLSEKSKLNVIARPLDNNLLEKKLHDLRTSLGAKIIYKHQAAKQILQSLGLKEMVAILIDQNVLRSQAIFVDFFGKKAATTPSLATFFIRTKSPLLPVFCYPTCSHKYHLQIFNPLEISLEGNYTQDMLKITQICTKIIETQIRKNPNYWLWFHNRWKTRPEGETKD